MEERWQAEFHSLNDIMHAWSLGGLYFTLKDFLHNYGLSTAAADNSVFFNEDIQVAVYVDDLLIFGSASQECSQRTFLDEGSRAS
jgi:hypothetical protein